MNQLVVSARWLFVQAGGCLTCLRNKAQEKRTLTFVNGVVVISYFVDGAIHWQCKAFLAYECGGFGKVSHLYY